MGEGFGCIAGPSRLSGTHGMGAIFGVKRLHTISVSNSLEEQELRSVDSLPNWLLGWHVWWAVA